MKNFTKNILSSVFIQRLFAYLVHFYIYLVYKTSKIVVKGNCEEVFEYVKAGKGIALFTWHGRMFLSCVALFDILDRKVRSSDKITILSSIHRDGKIVGTVMDTFGVNVIGGSSVGNKKNSSNKRSVASIRQIMKALSGGAMLVFVADGPVGPAYKMNTKITDLVKKTNTAIAWVSLSSKRKKIFDTWDKFQLPYPFNEIIIDYGNLVSAENIVDIDELNKKFESDLNEHTKINDGT